MWIISTTNGWIGTSPVTHVHGPQMMNHAMKIGTTTPLPKGWLLTMAPATSSSKFYLFCAIFQHLLDIYGPWMMNPDYSNDPDSFSTDTSRFIFVVLTEFPWIYFYNLLESVLEFISWIWLVILYSCNFLVTIKSDGSFPSAQNNCSGTLW